MAKGCQSVIFLVIPCTQEIFQYSADIIYMLYEHDVYTTLPYNRRESPQ